MSFYQVADSRGHTLFRKEDASKGKFAFTTEDYELFEVCFLSTVTGEPRLESVTSTCTQHTHAHNTIHTCTQHTHAHNTHMHTTRYTHAHAHNTHMHIPYRNFLIIKFTPFLLMVCLSSRSYRNT